MDPLSYPFSYIVTLLSFYIQGSDSAAPVQLQMQL